MNPPSNAPAQPPPRLTTEVITFIERAYWIIGAATLFWFIRAMAGVYRILDADLPFLGPCKPSETIIFTLLLLWLPLLALHLLTLAYQRRTHGSFPGVLGDALEIPRALRGLRWLLFFALVVFPTGSYILLTVRAFTHLSIVWKPEVDSQPWNPKAWPNARQRLAMLRFSSPPDGSSKWIFHGDWRWKHQNEEWRDEWHYRSRLSQSTTPETRYEPLATGTWAARSLLPPQPDKDRTAAAWLHAGDAASPLLELQQPAPVFLQRNPDGTFTERKLAKLSAWNEPVAEKKLVRVWISAWPGLQPLAFALFSLAFLILVLRELIRGWRGRRWTPPPVNQLPPLEPPIATNP